MPGDDKSSLRRPSSAFSFRNSRRAARALRDAVAMRPAADVRRPALSHRSLGVIDFSACSESSCRPMMERRLRLVYFGGRRKPRRVSSSVTASSSSPASRAASKSSMDSVSLAHGLHIRLAPSSTVGEMPVSLRYVPSRRQPTT